MLVAATLAVAGPDAALDPDDPAPRVGIVWDYHPTADRELHQRVAQALSDEAGSIEVVRRADDVARLAVAEEVPEAQARIVVELAGRLDAAMTTYRSGELESAAAEAWFVVLALERDPVLPGAPALAFRAHVLASQIAYTSGDSDEARRALERAVALDPDAHLSTRRVPPSIAELHESVRADVLADPERWAPIGIVSDDEGPVIVEIDGRAGRRPVPPGRHFVAVRRPGREPLGFVAEAGARVSIPAAPAQVRRGRPTVRADAEALCDHAGLKALVLAARQANRIGLERYECGEGFGVVWFSDYGTHEGGALQVPELERGVALMSARSNATRDTSLLAALPWPPPPQPEPPVLAARTGPELTDTQPRKPWFKRVWVWTVIGGVVIGGVTTAAVLGTRERSPDVRVDTESFLP